MELGIFANALQEYSHIIDNHETQCILFFQSDSWSRTLHRGSLRSIMLPKSKRGIYGRPFRQGNADCYRAICHS